VEIPSLMVISQRDVNVLFRNQFFRLRYNTGRFYRATRGTLPWWVGYPGIPQDRILRVALETGPSSETAPFLNIHFK